MLLSERDHATPDTSVEGSRIRLRCQRCGSTLGDFGDELGDGLTRQNEILTCSHCRVQIPCERGVWKALLPERAAYFARFVEDYQFIRAAEGRGSACDEYYLALPDRDLSGRNRVQWAIRARTFRYMERHILPHIPSPSGRQLRILDLGAGNGWMSYRLAKQHHSPIAVDLMTNDQDGLEAAEHFSGFLPRLFPRFQAEVDNLPFADHQFDLVIFNASFHYSEDYEKTMAEALRCTRNGGMVLIADSPWYREEASGVRMLEERSASFVKRYGFASDGLRSLEFLTDERLAQMELRFGFRWVVHKPYYGVRWQMRPWLAKLRNRRTPSEFRIYAATANQ